MMKPDRPITFAARLENVFEITLYGTADFEPWQKILTREKLVPFEQDGKAVLQFITAHSKWMGFEFRELSISIQLSQPTNQPEPAGFYLLHAYNSSPVLALSERMFFQTPYFYAKLWTQDHVPAVIRLWEGDRLLLDTGMGGSVQPLQSGVMGWEAPIYLPAKGKGEKPPLKRKYFMAKIGGETQVYPFVPGSDWLKLNPSVRSPVIQWLLDSNFAGLTWHIRPRASHAKSFTYTQNTPGAGGWGSE